MKPITRSAALEYHSRGRKGKIEVTATKPCLTQIDLSLAYSPGVAEPCREIHADPDKVFEYTARGNLVAVVTDGSAVLGLGNIGPLAGKPVMEGKAVLFKRFADIDVFDIELATQDVDEIVATVQALEPTVAGINLEDIASPRCFEVEQRLQEALDIPVFHDDQHGTAIISGAALLNGLALAGKDIADARIVVSGAGAAAVACADFAVMLGVRPENIVLVDSVGVIYKGRTERMNPFKERLARDTDARTLADAMVGADVFYGLSVGGLVTPEMLRTMAPDPIVLAMANPDPEIDYPDAVRARPDVIMATGRSDYPNQVNNVLGFPYIFRGALDVRARRINDAMKVAACRAIAALAREPVPGEVLAAYGVDRLEFGREYLVPKPLDSRVLIEVASAVAAAAMESGVARTRIDIPRYRRELSERMGAQRDIMRRVVAMAARNPKQIVYPEGETDTILNAAAAVVREGIARPVLVGDETRIRRRAEELGLSLDGMRIADPATWPKREAYAEELFELRQHRRSLENTRKLLLQPEWFGPMMVRMGDADGLICGVTERARRTMSPLLQIIPRQAGVRRACGMSILFAKDRALFLADTAVNIEPDAETLAEIAVLTADEVARMGIEPVVAFLSFSNYGGTPHPRSDLVRRAVELARELAPEYLVDGEMRADAALDIRVQQSIQRSGLGGRTANVLVCPNLDAANIAFNLARTVGEVPAVGPIMLGLDRPAHMLQPHSASVFDVIHLTAFAVRGAQDAEQARKELQALGGR
ncbi:MAG: NADP-dependent malic enzyme [Deltaproteobacteria bacterium]|nr:MAG: NADP-dependent malic enzyme [Deltaproteobacteria bacterium]